MYWTSLILGVGLLILWIYALYAWIYGYEAKQNVANVTPLKFLTEGTENNQEWAKVARMYYLSLTLIHEPHWVREVVLAGLGSCIFLFTLGPWSFDSFITQLTFLWIVFFLVQDLPERFVRAHRSQLVANELTRLFTELRFQQFSYSRKKK